MRNIQRAGVVLASVGLAAAGIATSASAGDASGQSAAMQEASLAKPSAKVDPGPQYWPVLAARIAYLGAKHAASTPAVRSQAANVARQAGGIFGAPPAKGGSTSSAVDVVFDR